MALDVVAGQDYARAMIGVAGGQRWRRRISWALVCGLGLAMSQPAVAESRREEAVERRLQAGQEALADGLYKAAQRFYERALRQAETPDQRHQARIGLCRSWDYLGDSEAILNLLDDALLASADEGVVPLYRFWRARAWYALQDDKAVITELNGVDPEALSDDDAALRLRMFSRAYARTGRVDAALRVFALFDRSYAEHAQAADNLLDWAQLVQASGDRAEAERLYGEVLTRFPEGLAAATVRLRLGQLRLAESDPQAALAVLEPLTTATNALPVALRAEGWYRLSEAQAARGAWSNALVASVEAESLAESTALRWPVALQRARLHFAVDQPEAAEQVVRGVLRATETDAVMQQALLVLAEGYLGRQDFERALAAYQDYLDAFEEPAGRAEAWLGKAWSLMGLRRTAEAASAFAEAYRLHPDVMARETALFKLADARFAEGAYAAARAEYQLVGEVFPESTLLPMAVFQAAECLARLQQVEPAVAEFRSIEAAYPATQYAEMAALRIGSLYEEQAAWQQAMAAYERLIRGYPDSDRAVQALHRRGLIQYRLGFFEDALRDFTQVVEQAPTDAAAEQAFYMRGWCRYLLGEDAEALRVAEAFVETYPDSIWLPEVRFWLAAYRFNRGEAEQAEREFLAVTEGAPESELADQALYWAARAALQQEAYREAIDYVTRLARRYPESARLADGRFTQGEALTQLGEFAGAILAFDQVVRQVPERPLAAAAAGRIGDCQFTLGADNPARYEEALASYQSVLDHSEATPEVRLEAEYKLGRTLEQMDRPAAALEHYLQVVYDLAESAAVRGEGQAVWFTRAAFRVAQMKQAEGDAAAAARVLQRVVDAGVPAAPDAARRIEALTGGQGGAAKASPGANGV
jgi:TolA-binding protein